MAENHTLEKAGRQFMGCKSRVFPSTPRSPWPSSPRGEKAHLLLEEGELDSAAVAPAFHPGSRRGAARPAELRSRPRGTGPVDLHPAPPLTLTPTRAILPRPPAGKSRPAILVGEQQRRARGLLGVVVHLRQPASFSGNQA